MQGEALRNIAREGYNNGTTQGKGKGLYNDLLSGIEVLSLLM